MKKFSKWTVGRQVYIPETVRTLIEKFQIMETHRKVAMWFTVLNSQYVKYHKPMLAEKGILKGHKETTEHAVNATASEEQHDRMQQMKNNLEKEQESSEKIRIIKQALSDQSKSKESLNKVKKRYLIVRNVVYGIVDIDNSGESAPYLSDTYFYKTVKHLYKIYGHVGAKSYT